LVKAEQEGTHEEGPGGTAVAVVLVVPAADAAKPKVTKAQAVDATKKFVKKDSRLTPKTTNCTRVTARASSARPRPPCRAGAPAPLAR
jgi:hypothetical protein